MKLRRRAAATASPEADSTTTSGSALRVLHVLAVSVPHLNGYTVRSRRIIEAQQRLGVQPVVVTSPFYPGNPAAIVERVIDGVHHFRVPHPSDAGERLNLAELAVAALYRLRHSPRLRRWIGGGSDDTDGVEPGRPPASAASQSGPEEAPNRRLGRAEKAAKAAARLLRQKAPWIDIVDRLRFAVERFEEACLLRRFETGIRRVATTDDVALIHAHSPFRCALPAVRVGRALGLPVIYEVRGVWEESAVASGFFLRGDRRYRHWRRSETAAMNRADAVICICEELRGEVIGRGVPAHKVFVVPNAADPPPGESNASSRAVATTSALTDGTAPTIRSALTVGYIGSLRALEGVDELVRCAAELLRRGYNVRLLVVGGGPALDGLRRLASELGLGAHAEFTGPVPHDQVWDLYQRIDVFAITRPDTAVTRMVTPLKPLEAMAMGRPLVVSNLPALREIVEDGTTGLLYTPGNVRQLADHCVRLLEDPDLRGRLSASARQWVLHHRTWTAVLAALPQIYAAVGAPLPGSSAGRQLGRVAAPHER